MVNVNKIVKTRVSFLVNSKKNFESIYNGMFLNPEYLFAETNDGYKITKYTFGDVDSKISDIAYSINKIYPDLKDQYIGIMQESTIEWIYIFFAILKSGNKPYLINLRHPKALINSLLKSLEIKYSIGLIDLKYDTTFIDLNTLNLKCENNYKFNFANEMSLSTSATTMKEKIIFYNGKEISEQILNCDYVLKNNKQVKKHYHGFLKQLVFLPLYHIFGFMATFMWFSYFGRCQVFLNDYSSDTILNTIKKHEVTHIFAVPLFWNTIERTILSELKNKDEKTQNKFKKGQNITLKLQSLFPSYGINKSKKLMKEITNKLFGKSVLFCITGGSYIKDSTLKLINSLGYPLYNGYGMSEIGITSVTLGGIKDRLNNNIGKPFKSVEYKIENNKLYVKGLSVSHKMKIDGVIYNYSDDEWFDTKDIVHEINGSYYIDGRADDLFIGPNGENINPDLLEKSLILDKANNISILDIDNNLSLVIEINEYMPRLIIDELYKLANDYNNQNDSSLRFNKIYFTYNSIKNPNAIKVSRQYLKSKIADGSVKLFSYDDIKTNDNLEIDTKILNKIKECIAQSLNINIEDINDNSDFFFDLNGSSLDYFDLIARLDDEFEIKLKFENDNIHTPIDFYKEVVRILSL